MLARMNFQPHVNRHLCALLAVLAVAHGPLFAAASVPNIVAPEHRVQLDDPAWRDLVAIIEKRPSSIVSDFEERRWFTFKKEPTLLKGEARVSRERGLSLHYPGSPERTVIIDDRGIVVREDGHDTTPPADSRAAAANLALLNLLRFDLRPLEAAFEIYGERNGSAWVLALMPRAESLRRTLGQISVAGEGPAVRRIELRRSATQRVEILVAAPRWQGGPFSADELRAYFR
jgi:hypothetical protein